MESAYLIWKGKITLKCIQKANKHLFLFLKYFFSQRRGESKREASFVSDFVSKQRKRGGTRCRSAIRDETVSSLGSSETRFRTGL